MQISKRNGTVEAYEAGKIKRAMGAAFASVGTVLDDEEADDEGVIGWYCVEESFFGKDDVEALRASNDQLDGYLDIVLAIMTISADEIAAGMPSLEEVSFFDLLDELEGIAVLIDEGALAKPLPFTFRLIGDALLGWESADEEDWR